MLCIVFFYWYGSFTKATNLKTHFAFLLGRKYYVREELREPGNKACEKSRHML